MIFCCYFCRKLKLIFFCFGDLIIDFFDQLLILFLFAHTDRAVKLMTICHIINNILHQYFLCLFVIQQIIGSLPLLFDQTV